MKFDLLELLAALSTAIGLFMVSEGFLLIGFGIGAASNFLWIEWARKNKAMFLLALQIALLLIAVNGIINNV